LSAAPPDTAFGARTPQDARLLRRRRLINNGFTTLVFACGAIAAVPLIAIVY
jgi:hypothetical protein